MTSTRPERAAVYVENTTIRFQGLPGGQLLYSVRGCEYVEFGFTNWAWGCGVVEGGTTTKTRGNPWTRTEDVNSSTIIVPLNGTGANCEPSNSKFFVFQANFFPVKPSRAHAPGTLANTTKIKRRASRARRSVLLLLLLLLSPS